MPYAFVQDVAASWEQYERLATLLIERAPPGLIVHAAGPTGSGFRTVEVWDNEHAWQRFRAGVLQPAVAAFDRPFRPQATFIEVRAANLVIGRRAASYGRARAGEGQN